MPPKEKKLSKEERKLARQKKNQENKCKLLPEYLDKEIKYGNVTRRKHESCWRELVMKIGLEKIRDDLEYTWQLFEWALDIKDCSISALFDELDIVNEQYSLCLQNHNMVVQRLLHKLNEHQKCMYEDFSKSLENMKWYYNEQYKNYKKKFENDQNFMKAVLYRMDADHYRSYRDQMSHFFYLLESFTATENERESYEEICGKRMKKLWDKSTRVLNDHISRSEKYTVAFQKDRMAIESSEVTIRKNLRKISYFTEILKKLQIKLSFLYNTDGEKLRQITDTQEELSMFLFILKDKLFKDNKRDTKRKNLLICSSETIMEHFRRILTKGELLLRHMTLIRKHETVPEKVLPFPVQDYYWKRTPSSLHKTSVRNQLFLFYQKIAVVDASRLALMEEKKALQLERIQMKRKFEEHCRCFDCIWKFPNIKREKKLKTLGVLGKSELATLFRWKHQVREDKAVKQKLREIKRKLIEDEDEFNSINFLY